MCSNMSAIMSTDIMYWRMLSKLTCPLEKRGPGFGNMSLGTCKVKKKASPLHSARRASVRTSAPCLPEINASRLQRLKFLQQTLAFFCIRVCAHTDDARRIPVHAPLTHDCHVLEGRTFHDLQRLLKRNLGRAFAGRGTLAAEDLDLASRTARSASS